MGKRWGGTVHIIYHTEKTHAQSKRNQLARQVSRLAQMANKRMSRLEKNNLDMVNAFKIWESQGKPHYSVKGKSYNELQSEYWKIKKVLDDSTSTVKGANDYLKRMASNIGFRGMTLNEIKQNITGYWKVFSKVQQYLSTIENEGYNIGSPRIQEMISNYVKTSKRTLNTVEELNNALNSVLVEVAQYAQLPEELTRVVIDNVWFELW